MIKDLVAMLGDSGYITQIAQRAGVSVEQVVAFLKGQLVGTGVAKAILGAMGALLYEWRQQFYAEWFEEIEWFLDEQREILEVTLEQRAADENCATEDNNFPSP